jgi:hypothetical protein
MSVDAERGELELQLTNGDQLVLNEQHVTQADLRLAYVQHPFPAQGHTTDTTHLIIAGQATREGTYVAITRAREQTHIYSAPSDSAPDADQLRELAERVSQTEPEMPSISTPLAYEAAVAASTEREADDQQLTPTGGEEITHQPVEDRSMQAQRDPEHLDDRDLTVDPPEPSNGEVPELTGERADPWLEPSGEQRPASTPAEPTLDDTPRRTWPGREPRGPEPDVGLTREETNGWEM